jgi:PP-loop superfamily ATP-utilizing enzyme
MNESDPLITFNDSGLCSRCQQWERDWAEKLKLEAAWPEAIIRHIKAVRAADELTTGRNQEYDAVIGLSGGADSSWVYHLAKTQGLSLYPVHFDNGYDLPQYAENPKLLTDHWGDELHTVKVDGPEFRALQLAFLKSGTTGLEIPTDHAIKAVTYQTAHKLGVSVLLNGTNLATESHGTPAWTQGHADWKYIDSVAKQFSVHLKTFPHYTMWDKITWMSHIEWVSLLEYVQYNRDEAIGEMQRIYGYVPYGFKHGESRITRFLHGYIIPRRFGWDTRRSRLAAMVCSGNITREAALEMLKKTPYPLEQMEEDKLILCRNLGITEEYFEELMNLPLHNFSDYPSYTNDPVLHMAQALYRRIR